MTTSASPGVLCPATTLTSSAATYITCNANVQTIIKRAVFSNFTAGAITITAYRVISGGTAVNANIIIPARSIAAGGTDLAPELANAVLNAGDTIQCLASANTSINFTASGFITS